ncbi:DUF4326 domain-containing protein [Kitasatospora phosalacinea]|uniref:DUF4326 domain-containing protein n=1 Tax=Kitasatospora phosalacinea TaxID=2065 RepID=A0ABW6GRT3_9ACTN
MSTATIHRTPRRIQRQRTAGWRKPEGAIYVGRPTPFGNPYRITRIGTVWCVYVDIPDTGRTITVSTVFDERQARQDAVDGFRDMFCTPGGAEQAAYFARELHGRDLLCWCAPDMPCHADVLIEIANGGAS